MIQRIQTLYLFAAAILSSLAAFILPMYVVEELVFRATSSMVVFHVWMVHGYLLRFYFNVPKRPFQLLLVRLGMLSSLIVVALLIKEITATEGASAAYGAIVPMLNIVLAFLASRGIQKDEAKIKSLDRLR